MTKKQQGCRRARYCHIICRQQKNKWKRKQKKKWKQKQKKKWNPIDIRDLKQLVKKGYSFELIQECLNHYSIHAIRIQAKKLGLKHSKTWKEHELKVLRYGLNSKMTYEQIQKQFLSHRSPQALAAQARNQGWKSCVISTWDQQDLDLLKQGLDEGLTYSEIRDTYLTHRTSDALKTQALRQGWTSQLNWDQQDLDLLKQGLDEGLTYSEIRDTYLPHRTSDALKTQACKQGWKLQSSLDATWNQQDLDFLKKGLDEGLTYSEIRDTYLTHRTSDALKTQACKQDWKSQSSVNATWDQEDLDFLKQGLDEGLTYSEIRDTYLPHRTSDALNTQACKQGWKSQSFLDETWDQQDLDFLKQGLEESLTLQEIIDQYLPNRTLEALKYQMNKHGWKQLAKKWTFTELLLLDLGLYNGLSLQEIQNQSLPHRTLKELEARINVPDWNKKLYDWHLPFSIDDVCLAFIAGFILADAHVTKNNLIVIRIAKIDKHLLEYICDVFHFAYSRIKNSNGDVYLILPASLSRLFIKHFHLSPQKSCGQVVFPHFLNDQCQKALLLGLWFGDKPLRI